MQGYAPCFFVARNLSIPTILSLADSTSFHAIIEALFQGDEAES